jgi:hypothetical protein
VKSRGVLAIAKSRTAHGLAEHAGEGPGIRSISRVGINPEGSVVGESAPGVRVHAAVGTRRDWHAIDRAVDGTICNYWSKNDAILRYVYRAGEAGAKAIGSEGVPKAPRTIKNVDVSKKVGAHQHHLTSVTLR